MDVHIAAEEADTAFRRACEALGEELRASIDGVLKELALRGMNDQRSIQRTFDLSQSATSRLLAAVRTGDALATLSLIPGPDALQQMASGAAKAGVDAASLNRVSDAIVGMRSFLNAQIGGRSTLDAVLSDWVPESRASFELRHKAAAYRSMSAVRGVQADLVLTSGIVYPSGDPALHDTVGLDAVLGCRRVRPNGMLRLSGSQIPPADAKFSLQSLDGGPIASMNDTVLRAYTTIPPECIQTTNHGDVLETTVRELPLGGGDSRNGDLVSVQVLRAMHRAKRGTSSRTAGFAGQAEPPAEHFVLDVLLHDDVWPGINPELSIYDTVVRGNAHPDDPARRADRLDMMETVQFLGRGPDAFRLTEFPRYTQLMRDVCERLSWDASRLRGFRAKVRYPIYGSQIGMAFPLPD